MNKKPVTATPDLLISSAIILMNKNSITSLLIVKNNTPIGIVNLKNCLENE
jgi:CBS domain-containing protein